MLATAKSVPGLCLVMRWLVRVGTNRSIRLAGEKLPIDLLPVLRLPPRCPAVPYEHAFLRTNDRQSQSREALLLAEGGEDPNPAISNF
jgi:hypothetical protein